MAANYAITFDLWDTVFCDDSDEPKRAAAGLPTKRVARRDLLHAALLRHGPIDRAHSDLAYDTADAAFSQVWNAQAVTWTVAERLAVVLKGLGRSLPQAEFAELVRLHEQMEVEIQPDLAPGIATALRTLAGRYRLGVISDTVFSPGTELRRILRGHDLEDCFSSFVFSDEAGHSKPAPALFHLAAEQLSVPVTGLIHVGDRESKDIVGPHAVGARAVLTTVVLDRRKGPSAADAHCADYADLVAIIDGLCGVS